MVRDENIESKLAALRRYLKHLERYKNQPFASILANPDLIAALERYLYLALQSTVDLAEMLCKRKQYGKPASMADSFDILRQAGVIDINLSREMIKMVGFRNWLSHGYDKLDYAILESVLRVHLSEVERFADIISSM